MMNMALADLCQVNSVILSHAHFDHVCGLPFLVELRKQMGLGPLHVYANVHTLQTLKAHLFNDQLWPDFTQLPNSVEPALQFHLIEADRTFMLGGLQVRPIDVAHTVPTLGFFIGGATGWIAYSGDTSPCLRFTEALQTCANLRHVIVECSFPAGHAELAFITAHMHSGDLNALRCELSAQVPLWATSSKSWFRQSIEVELALSATAPVLQFLEVGQRLTF